MNRKYICREQPSVRQMPIGYFRTYSYQPLNYGGLAYNWPNIYSNDIGYPSINPGLLKPVEETTSTTTTTTTTQPTTTSTTTTTTEKPTTTTSAPVYQQSSQMNQQYMSFSRAHQQIPTYFRNSQQLQQDFQAYMQYLAFTQMSSMSSPNQQGPTQFIPCMCPVSMVQNEKPQKSPPNEFLSRENRESDDENAVVLEDEKDQSQTTQPFEEIESGPNSQKESNKVLESEIV